jgi:NAD(P)H dehydrogenase (quinone)
MMTVLIVVDSWQGHAARVADEVRSGAESEGAVVVMRSADEATLADVRQAAALIMGSAVHQRGMTWKMKRFVDEVCEPVWFYDDLVGKVGAVFTAGGGHGQAGGGSEQAQIDMMANLAACGAILVPLPKCTPGFEHAGVHWGPTVKTTDEAMNAIDPSALDAEAMQAFFHHGANVARVARSLEGLTLARGNRWPSAEVVAGRRAFEANRPSDVRMASSADPVQREPHS